MTEVPPCRERAGYLDPESLLAQDVSRWIDRPQFETVVPQQTSLKAIVVSWFLLRLLGEGESLKRHPSARR